MRRARKKEIKVIVLTFCVICTMIAGMFQNTIKTKAASDTITYKPTASEIANSLLSDVDDDGAGWKTLGAKGCWYVSTDERFQDLAADALEGKTYDSTKWSNFTSKEILFNNYNTGNLTGFYASSLDFQACSVSADVSGADVFFHSVVDSSGKYAWPQGEEFDSSVTANTETYPVFFDDDDAIGLAINLSYTGKNDDGDKCYSGYVLVVNGTDNSFTYLGPTDSNSSYYVQPGIYYLKDQPFRASSFNTYTKNDDGTTSKTSSSQLLKACESIHFNNADDGSGYKNLKFESEVLENGNVKLTAYFGKDSDGSAHEIGTVTVSKSKSYCYKTGGVAVWAWSQPCASFKNVTIKGIQNQITYNYDANGGTFSDGSTVQSKSLYSITTKSGDTRINTIGTLASTPTRTGYYTDATTSTGWYTKKSGGDEITSSTKALYDNGKTFYAHWSPYKLTINYNANGGTFPDDATKKQVIKYDDSSKLTGTIPTKEGYYFAGWTASSTWNDDHTKYKNSTSAKKAQSWASLFDAQTTDTVNIDTANDSVTLYAQWKPNTGKIYYDANGGSIAGDDGLPTGVHKYTNPDTGVTVYYKLDSDGIVLKSSTSTVTDMYAKSINYESTEFNPTNVGTFGIKRAGYHVKSGEEWNTKSDGTGTSYNQGSNEINKAKSDLKLSSETGNDITLYAQWEINTLSIYYHLNNGSEDASASTSTYWKTATADYGTNYTITTEKPTRTGYTFKGWGNSANWTTSYQSGTKKAESWATTVGGTDNALTYQNRNIHLFAQWERTITHTFNYYKSQSTSATVTFHNADSTQTMTIPSAVMNDATYDGYTWSYRGISTSSASNVTVSYANGTKSITVNATDSNTTYYSSYQRTVRLILKDYGDNEAKIDTKTGTATMRYDGAINSPTFTFPSLNTMKLKEKDVAGTEQNETWTALGWSTSKAAKVTIDKKVGDTLTTYKDTTYHGRYEKDVTITYDANGGSVSPTSGTVTRNFNASEDKNFDNPILTFPIPSYKENGVDKYNWGGWLYKKLAVNAEDFDSYLVGITNNAGSFTYVPLVKGTVYAYWKYINYPDPYSPITSISKSATWNNPAGDNETVDFDNLKNIDIDGIAKVTVKAKITDKDGIGARSITVTDYFNTTMWDYYEDATYKASVSKGSFTRTDDTFTWTIPNDYTSGSEMTFTYYVKLKEKYWTVDINEKEITGDTDHYINTINDLVSYKKELNEDGNLKSTSTYQTKDKESLINLHYTIDGGLLSGLSVNKYNSTPYVVMRPVNWIPKINNADDNGIGIESDKNNIYRDEDAAYKYTYFVQYDTHSVDSSNSTFRIWMKSHLDRSYSFYQITNNLFDIKTGSKIEQVYNNSIGLNTINSTTFKDSTNEDLDTLGGFSAGSLYNVASAANTHSSVTTEGVKYPYGELISKDTVYATNQDGLLLSVYPFIRTTNSLTGKVYETTRNVDTLKNKRLDLIIDASNPIITPDNRIKTESEEYGEWTLSDGYADLNLISDINKPEAQAHTLEFKFEDEISGINAPDAYNDWIVTSNQNVQVKIVNVDTEKEIFNSLTHGNNTDIVKVIYNDTDKMNKKGSVNITLDPENDDLLGHLKITIKVIDNVGNWEEKTYDIYSFCLTGEISVADIATYVNGNVVIKENKSTEFINGQQGEIKIGADGYIDRVKVDFGNYLDSLHKSDLQKRNATGGTNDTINGDYPSTDLKLLTYVDDIDTSMTYLPREWRVLRWGYTEDELGGVRLTEAYLNVTNNVVIRNDMLNAHIDELIANYSAIAIGLEAEDIKEENYAIIEGVLYTYPRYERNEVKSYSNKYTAEGAIMIDGEIYPENIVLDGVYTLPITYEEKDASVEYPDEENELYKASIDVETVVKSEWIQKGDALLRPFIHYFYMPLRAEENTYYAVLTAYKDSNTDFPHHVSVRLPFTNKGSILDDLRIYIKDN